MDHEFFAAVNKRLKELEDERDRRYQTPAAAAEPRLRDYLWRHPKMFATCWTVTDQLVDTENFDWDSEIFPEGYVQAVKRGDISQQYKMAHRPYVLSQDRFAVFENTLTMVARLIVLNLEDLLSNESSSI